MTRCAATIPPPSAPPGRNAAIHDAVGTLELRLNEIETVKLPAFEAEGATARLRKRIEKLERRLGATIPDPAVVPAEPHPAETESAEASPQRGHATPATGDIPETTRRCR